MSSKPSLDGTQHHPRLEWQNLRLPPQNTGEHAEPRSIRNTNRPITTRRLRNPPRLTGLRARLRRAGANCEADLFFVGLWMEIG